LIHRSIEIFIYKGRSLTVCLAERWERDRLGQRREDAAHARGVARHVGGGEERAAAELGLDRRAEPRLDGGAHELGAQRVLHGEVGERKAEATHTQQQKI